MASVALNYFGPITTPATTQLRNAICRFSSEAIESHGGPHQYKYDTLFLLISSDGGNLEDGFSLYNLLRLTPVEVVTINTGQIASAAIVPFLAGDKRIACPNAYFHFEQSDWTYPANHKPLFDTARTNSKALFKERTKASDADVEALMFSGQPVTSDAHFALEKGIVHEIRLPFLPAGTAFFNVDY